LPRLPGSLDPAFADGVSRGAHGVIKLELLQQQFLQQLLELVLMLVVLQPHDHDRLGQQQRQRQQGRLRAGGGTETGALAETDARPAGGTTATAVERRNHAVGEIRLACRRASST